MDRIKLWKDKDWQKTPEFSAVASALIYGMLVHLFALTNLIHNHDNIASQPGGFGMGVDRGRWFLEILGRFFDKAGFNYNVPSNGMVYILLLAIAAGFLVSALRIRSRMSAGLIGALFVAFPTVSATMLYRFTVVFYGISTLCAVLAAWVLPRSRWGVVLSAGLVALSLGIFQAYIPLTIGLMVLQLICEGLRGEADAKKLICHGLSECVALLLGVILYFACVKLSVAAFGMPFDGSSGIGVQSLSQLPQLIVNALRSVCMLPLQDYYGVANRALMRITYLLLPVLTAAMLVLILRKNIRNTATAFVICLLFPAFALAVGFMEVMADKALIYTLMVYAFCLLACAPLAFWECIPQEDRIQKMSVFFRQALSFLVALLVCFYGYYANVNYTAAHLASEQVSNYLSGVVLRGTMAEGYTTDKQWVFLGDIQDPLLGGVWNDEISYGGFMFTEQLLNEYSRNGWIINYTGYDLPMAEAQVAQALAESEEVQAMPCYPNAGSVRIIADTVVVKFQDAAQ